MTDIVARLRQLDEDARGAVDAFGEAADEIERLRAALNEIAVLFDRGGADMPDLAAIARDAIGEDK